MSLTQRYKEQKQQGKKKWPSLRIPMGLFGLKFRSQTKDVSASNASTYECCDTLPLTIFIECLLHQKYHLLGSVNNDELWLRIYSEYLELLNDATSINSLYQIVQYTILDIKIYKVSILIKMLSIYYDERLSDLLKSEGYNFDFTKPEMLERVLNLLKQDEIKRDGLKIAIQATQGESDDKQPITSKYFDEMLISYEQAFKVPCNKNDITVQEYCIRVNRLKEFIANNQPKNDY